MRLTPSCLAMARLLIPSLRSCFISGTSLPAVIGRIAVRLQQSFEGTEEFSGTFAAAPQLKVENGASSRPPILPQGKPDDVWLFRRASAPAARAWCMPLVGRMLAGSYLMRSNSIPTIGRRRDW